MDAAAEAKIIMFFFDIELGKLVKYVKRKGKIIMARGKDDSQIASNFTDKKFPFGKVLISIFGIAVLLAVIMPVYNVWLLGMEGKAELWKAEQNRQIIVQEAQAKRDSATLLAEAEIERAKGVAKANEIVKESLEGDNVYLQYLWIQALKDGHNQVIYVATEAGIPIMEAGKRPESK